MHPIKQSRRLIARRNPATFKHQGVEHSVGVGWMQRVCLLHPEALQEGMGEWGWGLHIHNVKKWVLYSTFLWVDVGTFGINHRSTLSDLAPKTIKSGSPGYEPGAIHLFQERTMVTMIVWNWVAKNGNQKLCIKLKLCCNLPLVVLHANHNDIVVFLMKRWVRWSVCLTSNAYYWRSYEDPGKKSMNRIPPLKKMLHFIGLNRWGKTYSRVLSYALSMVRTFMTGGAVEKRGEHSASYRFRVQRLKSSTSCLLYGTVKKYWQYLHCTVNSLTMILASQNNPTRTQSPLHA